MKKHVKGLFILSVLLFAFNIFIQPVYATSGNAGNVSTAIESTWKAAAEQVKTVCDRVVFPLVDLVLVILLFVKLATSYFEYKKQGQFEFTGAAILFAGLIFMLTAPLYIWNIIGL